MHECALVSPMSEALQWHVRCGQPVIDMEALLTKLEESVMH